MRKKPALLPLGYSIPGAAAATSFSESVIEAAIRAEILPVRRHGNRTIVLASDLARWLNSLPTGRQASPPQLEGKRTGRPKKVVSCTSNVSHS